MNRPLWFLLPGLVLVLLPLGAQLNFTIPGNPFHSPSTPSDPVQTAKGMGDMAKGATGISLHDELIIGQSVSVDIVSRYGGLDQNEAKTRRVALIGKSLARSCTRQELTFRFAILNSDEVNAFSAPGGYVFITRGLYAAVADDNELAAVLAHEISHIARRHALKIISRGTFLKGMFSTAGSVSNFDLFEQGVKSISDHLLNQGYDKDYEYDADKQGRALATKVGFSSNGLLDFLKTLHGKVGDTKAAFSTHPPLSHRIERLEEK